MNYGFKFEPADPTDTSVLGKKLSRRLGPYVHTALTYAVALRYLNKKAFEKLLSLEA
jgi:hypothetical protein